MFDTCGVFEDGAFALFDVDVHGQVGPDNVSSSHSITSTKINVVDFHTGLRAALEKLTASRPHVCANKFYGGLATQLIEFQLLHTFPP